jgi:hypothetical protein
MLVALERTQLVWKERRDIDQKRSVSARFVRQRKR